MNLKWMHGLGGAMLAAVLVVPAAAQDKALSDAQVEANVLRALASAPELSTQNIQSTTVYGVVTLSGNVHNEALRTQAENLAARATGVKKVVDQLVLGDTPVASNGDGSAMPADQQPDTANGNVPQGEVLQSDGTYAPAAPADQGAPPAQAQNGPPPSQQPQGGYYSQNGPPNGYQQGPPAGRQPLYQRYSPPEGVPGGQRAGVQVTVPAGAVLRIRINRGLDSQHIQPGTAFDGTVLTDVVADGAVAIPRGATVLGTVVDAKKAGVFKGEGELGLQISSVTLGGTVYPVSTEVWQREGRDKAAGTVNNTVGLGALGAIVGAVAGGGEGAAIGAGVGGAAGLAGSAATPRGQIIIPPESVLTFRTAQPAVVKTVSEAEMARLSYAAGPQQPQGPPRVRYYNPYYGPYGPYYGPPRY
jgi:hypothetical protein